MRFEYLSVLAAVLVMQIAAAAQGCDYGPTITSLTPSSARIYPAQYLTPAGVPITCTPTSICTLSDMIFATLPLSWSGSNICGIAFASFLQLPVWWGITEGVPLGTIDPPCAGFLAYGIPDTYLGLGGGCFTAGVGTMVPAELGGVNNPLTGVNLGGQLNVLYDGNSLPFNLIGPKAVEVISDYWEYCPNCDTTVERITTYKAINSDGSVAANIPIGEDMTISGWNCTQANPGIKAASCTVPDGTWSGNVLSGGMFATDANGEFADIWTLNDDIYTPAGCGHNMRDYYQLCGLSQKLDSVFGLEKIN